MRLLRRFDHERLALVGHGMGGSVACILAGAGPELVHAVALLEGYLFAMSTHPGRARAGHRHGRRGSFSAPRPSESRYNGGFPPPSSVP